MGLAMGSFFVIKRDGSRSVFEIQRIINAIRKAAKAVEVQDERFCHQIGQQVCDLIFTQYQNEIDISQIQQIVILNTVTIVIWRGKNAAN